MMIKVAIHSYILTINIAVASFLMLLLPFSLRNINGAVFPVSYYNSKGQGQQLIVRKRWDSDV